MDKKKLEELTSSTWSQHQLEVVLSQDGSPSLRFLDSQNQELMHHSGGAWSETEYIYGKPLSLLLQSLVFNNSFGKISSQSVASVGLGLGYNELLTVKTFLQSDFQSGHSSEFKLYSFEKFVFLRDSFLKFILNETLNSEIQAVYDSVLQFVTGEQSEGSIQAKQIKAKLKEMYHNHSWYLLGPLEEFSSKTQKNFTPFTVILYDAFSSKTSPELWQEEFLSQIILETAAADCVFSTYACTGSLKRSLKKNNFHFIERPGFMGKRNSSLAVRGFNFSLSDWIEIC